MTVARGAVLKGIDQPMVVEELEWDEPRADEVAVRVLACGVCHTDYHAIKGEYPMEVPIVLGHEGAGIVEKVGADCTRVKVGDHVVLSWMPSCGHCPSCVAGDMQLCDRGANLISGRIDGRQKIHTLDGQGVDQFSFLGCFSEYVVVLEDGCVVVDKDIDLTKICIVGCRIPTGWGAVVNAAKARAGSTALVVGLGGVGFNMIQGLKTAGAVVIIGADTDPGKERWAREWGVTHFIDASTQDITAEVKKITGAGVDYAFDGIGAASAETACIESLCKTGTAVFAGVPPASEKGIACSPMDLIYSQKTVMGTLYGHSNPAQSVPQLVKMYKAGILKMDELITKEYKLEQINEAFDDMIAGKNICGSLRMDW